MLRLISMTNSASINCYEQGKSDKPTSLFNYEATYSSFGGSELVSILSIQNFLFFLRFSRRSDI